MAWEDFFNHKCNIYHASKGSEDLGYGVVDDNVFTYPEEAEEKEHQCHFHVKTGNYQVGQTEPINEYDARIKLSLPLDTDIRVNDKVESLETGYVYIAEIPRRIQNHHIIVYIHRDGPTREAI